MSVLPPSATPNQLSGSGGMLFDSAAELCSSGGEISWEQHPGARRSASAQEPQFSRTEARGSGQASLSLNTEQTRRF